MGFFRRRYERARQLWRRALEENTSPEKFAWAVAVGLFMSGAPLPPVFPVRMTTAIGVAWLARLNRLTAAMAVNLLGPVALPIIALNVKIGGWILGRPIPTPNWHGSVSEKLRQGVDCLLDWSIGSIVVAPTLAVVGGLFAYRIAKTFQRSRRHPGPAPAAVGAPADWRDRAPPGLTPGER